jgi:calcineurin-like phosphoesterase family protein
VSTVFFTSDLHFQHARIVGLSERPFGSVEEMDEHLIARWNSVVLHPTDIVWVLGDYTLGDRARGLSYLSRLNGRKMLVSGNHDKCWVGSLNGHKYIREYMDAGFEVVTPFAQVKLPPTRYDRPGRTVSLSHFPYTADHRPVPRHLNWRLHDDGETWLVHGHVHTEYLVRERGVNVGVDRWDYAPVPAATVAALIDAVESGQRDED